MEAVRSQGGILVKGGRNGLSDDTFCVRLPRPTHMICMLVWMCRHTKYVHYSHLLSQRVAKWGWDVAHVVDCLLSIYKALGLSHK